MKRPKLPTPHGGGEFFLSFPALRMARAAKGEAPLVFSGFSAYNE